MITLILTPHMALQPYIQHYVYCEIGNAGKWSCTNMAPPGCTSLSIAAGGKNVYISENAKPAVKYESVTFVGQTTRFKKLSLFDHLKTFFVIFRPCGAYQLLGIKQDECSDSCTNLSELLGASVRLFEEELAEQTSPEYLKAVVERFFFKQIDKQRKREESVQLARAVKQIRLNSYDGLLIETLCRKEGYSISRLERHMRRIVGMSPKKYQRIMRFNAVLQYINRNPLNRNWSAIANRFGYYDQTHFIKEFKLFYGKTPVGYTDKDHFLSNIASIHEPRKIFEQ
jgi:AraC-like DNA-binding protein